MIKGIMAAASALAAILVLAEDGEYTLNAMPGTNTVWTAGRTRREIAAWGSTDTVARAAAAFAYSPTNQPPALTNYLFAAIYTNGAWWAVKIAPTP